MRLKGKALQKLKNKVNHFFNSAFKNINKNHGKQIISLLEVIQFQLFH